MSSELAQQKADFNKESQFQSEVEAELKELRLKVKQLQRDNRILAVMNENAEKLRISYEMEKKLHYLYNDLLLSNCPNMIFLFNEQLQLVICSEACQPLLAGQFKQDLANLPFRQVFGPNISTDWVDKIYHQNLEMLKNRSSQQYNDTVMFCDGGFMHAQVMISAIVDDKDMCRGTIMTINDITELTQTKLKAEEAARSKSSFLANMSHEIRTPMNAVKGLSELLALTELNGLQRNYITNIISSANSLLGIINDVLDFSKIDANRMEFIEGPYDLADMVSGVSNVINLKADDKNLLLMIEAAPDLPATLWGDDVRVKQIMTNMLSNAVKYTNEGYVKLSLHMEYEAGVSYLVCSVADSGIGIKADDVNDLFDAFSRVDLVTNRSINGTGLGLAISRQLALAMGGDIWVNSEYGKGSVFTFRIPQKVIDSTPIAEVHDRAAKKVLLLDVGRSMHYVEDLLESLQMDYVAVPAAKMLPSAGELAAFTHCIHDDTYSEEAINILRKAMPQCRFGVLKNIRHAMAMSDNYDTILYMPLFIKDLTSFLNKTGHESEIIAISASTVEEVIVKNVKLLVVDDNEINLVVSTEMLRSFEAEVFSAESGDEAVALCRECKFDLIFMDHMMPGKDGIETAMEIRADQERGLNRDTPIIALTANVVNDMASYYLQCGLDDFIAKPVEMTGLGQMLIKWLPPEKIAVHGLPDGDKNEGKEDFPADFGGKETVTPQELIAALDNFGLYSSDVMREVNGDFEIYVKRMEDAAQVLGDLTDKLKLEVAEERWDEFADDIFALNTILYGIGARDCAARARKLSQAARSRNINYIHGDFFSLMGNMYMLDKKLIAIVPVARTGDLKKIPLNVPQALHGSLEKLGRAIKAVNAVEAMVQLANTASLSLDMDLDMALKAIKTNLENGDFAGAEQKHDDIFHVYTERMAARGDMEARGKFNGCRAV